MKITPQQAAEIFDDVRPIAEIAAAYNVHQRNIEDLLKGRTRHTKDSPELLEKAAWRNLDNGSRGGNGRRHSKLTADDVAAILADERPASVIAKDYVISSAWVHKLKAGNIPQYAL